MAQHSTGSKSDTCDSKDGAASNCCSAYLEVPGPVALLSWLCFFHFRRLQPPKLPLSGNMCDLYLSWPNVQVDCGRIVPNITDGFNWPRINTACRAQDEPPMV